MIEKKTLSERAKTHGICLDSRNKNINWEEAGAHLIWDILEDPNLNDLETKSLILELAQKTDLMKVQKLSLVAPKSSWNDKWGAAAKAIYERRWETCLWFVKEMGCSNDLMPSGAGLINIASGRDPLWAMRLMDEGVTPSIRDHFGDSALMELCSKKEWEEDDFQLAGRLLDFISIDMTNNNGNGPLHNAAVNGNKNACVFLLEKGADPDKKNGTDKSAADYAQMTGHGEISSYLKGLSEARKEAEVLSKVSMEKLTTDFVKIEKLIASGRLSLDGEKVVGINELLSDRSRAKPKRRL